jgi:hypothetical protein
MKLIYRAAAVTTTAALVIGAFGVAVASAGTPVRGRRPATPVAAATGLGGRQKAMSDDARAQLRSTGHVEITKHPRRRAERTFLVQSGEVTAAGATSITLRSKDGYTHEYAVDAATKVRSRAGVGTFADVKLGGTALVIAGRTGAGDFAKRIRIVGLRAAARS